jgi:hypothetical protein
MRAIPIAPLIPDSYRLANFTELFISLHQDHGVGIAPARMVEWFIRLAVLSEGGRRSQEMIWAYKVCDGVDLRARDPRAAFRRGFAGPADGKEGALHSCGFPAFQGRATFTMSLQDRQRKRHLKIWVGAVRESSASDMASMFPLSVGARRRGYC